MANHPRPQTHLDDQANGIQLSSLLCRPHGVPSSLGQLVFSHRCSPSQDHVRCQMNLRQCPARRVQQAYLHDSVCRGTSARQNGMQQQLVAERDGLARSRLPMQALHLTPHGAQGAATGTALPSLGLQPLPQGLCKPGASALA